jgi:hypothetical protein
MIVGSITDVKSQVNLRDDVSGTYRLPRALVRAWGSDLDAT